MKKMKRKLSIGVVCCFWLISMVSCAHWSDPCENKLLQRLSSPNKGLVVSTYHRECSSKIYTTAAVEEPPGLFGQRGDVVCYLMLWGDRHPVETTWPDSGNIFIKTTDKLERIDRSSGEPESCQGINIHYDFQIRQEKQVLDDPQIVEQLMSVTGEMAPCINAYYQAVNPHNNPSKDINTMIANDEHRSALENLLGYIHDSHCRVSVATYEKLKHLSDAFDLKPMYIEGIEDLVVHPN